MPPRRAPLLLAAPAILGAVAGCSLVSLDELDDGTGGAAGTVASASASTFSSTSTASSSSVSTGDASTTGGGEGGDSATTSTSSTGGACPDSCADSTAGLCDSFDAPGETLNDWVIARGADIDSDYRIITDRFESCPAALEIDFGGIDTSIMPEPTGAWLELGKRLPGVPAQVAFDVSMYRDTDNLEMEGVIELGWKRGSSDCFIDVQIEQATDEHPAAAQAYLIEFPEGQDAVSPVGVFLGLEQLPTSGVWLDLGLDMDFETRAGTLRVNGTPKPWDLDPDGITTCDDGPPNEGSVGAFVGPIFNQLPVKLVFDDYRVVAQ